MWYRMLVYSARNFGVQMKTDDFDYDLPEKFIAQVPATPRDSCKLMVVQRGGALEHRRFYDIKEYLRPGDLLVVNETRVLPARLLGKKKGTGGHVETLLLDKVAGAPCTNEEQTWNCLVKPGKRLKVGSQVVYEADGVCLLEGEILSIDPGNGSRAVRFSVEPGKDVDAAFHAIGHTPLPPYIKDYTGDEELYQTVYARDERSAAAPTAGLHFTRELLESLQAAGVGLATVDLEVGLDTFRIVGEDDPLDHQMHTELYTVPPDDQAKWGTCYRRWNDFGAFARKRGSARRTGRMHARGDESLYLAGIRVQGM